MTALELVGGWPTRAAAGWFRTVGPEPDGAGRAAVAGPTAEVFEWASVTKVLTAVAVWVAVEEGTVAWDDPAGPPGATLAHLLAHASGLDVDRPEAVAPPGRERIYSNAGFEAAAAHVGRAAGMPFERYLSEAVIEPLGLSATRLEGSPASGARGPLPDLLRLAGELSAPTVFSPATLSAVTAVAFPGLAGVLPGFGRQDPNDWGLGVEVRGRKRPHWTGTANSPATYGHFGRSGSFVWVDPVARVAAAALADRPFGAWAAQAWPELSDAVLAEAAAAAPPAAP